MMQEERAATIRPAAATDVPLLEAVLQDVPQGKQRARIADQAAGMLVYLVAWHGRRPVGHVLVRWKGCLPGGFAPGCPLIEDLFVLEAQRGRGIGRRLLAEAERLVQAHGPRRVALAVGLLPHYEPAHRLYAQRGYRHIGYSPSYQGWWTYETTGTPVWWEEAVEYLAHELS
jgi:GNAT superfamily N-acetyltransferase